MNKTATRIPEAMFAAFNVVPDARDAALDGWSMNKLGEDLQINRLDMQARRGNAHQHGVLDGFAYGFGDARLQVRTLDAGIVVAGNRRGSRALRYAGLVVWREHDAGEQPVGRELCPVVPF